MLWLQLGQSLVFFEAQRICLLTLIPFISSCQPFWERDSHMTVTSDNTKDIRSLSFLEEVVTSMQFRTPGGENIPPKKRKNWPHLLVTQISYLKTRKLDSSQCLCD